MLWSITDKLRIELRNSRKRREIVAKIIITTEYDYNNHTIVKKVAKQGMFVLQKPYIFEPVIFLCKTQNIS